jgi:nitrite reductase (NADH) small subunit
MAEFVLICAQAELPLAGQVREVAGAGRTFCVANVEGAIHVLDGVCPHEGGPLGEGAIEEGRVVCPWHAFAFNVQTGVAQDDPELRVAVFEARVEDGELRVKF